MKIKTKDDEHKQLNYLKKKHDYQKILKFLKINKDYCKKIQKPKQKSLSVCNRTLLRGIGLTDGCVLINTRLGSNVGIKLAAASSFIANIAVLITSEFCSNVKMRYTKLPIWIKLTTIVYEKLLNKSMIDNRTDEREGGELKRIYTNLISINVKVLRKAENFQLNMFSTMV